MEKLNNGPSIFLIIFSTICYNLLCYFLGTDTFYSIVSFVFAFSLSILAIYFFINKDLENLIIIIILICVTETVFRSQNYIPYRFSSYVIIALSFYHFLSKPRNFINCVKKMNFLTYMGLLLVLMILNNGGSTDAYLHTLKFLGVPRLSVVCISYFILINEIKISFEKLFNYMLLFLAPMLSNLVYFGNKFEGRTWPPWGDGTGPAAGLAVFCVIISAHMLWKKNNFLYLIPLYFSSYSLILLSSRGAIIGLSISLIISVLYFLKSKQYKLFSKKTLLFVIALTLISSLEFGQETLDRFKEIKLYLNSEQRSGRILVAIATYYAFFERPFFGGGTGSFASESINRISDFDIVIRRNQSQILTDAHSFIIQNIFEHGLVGFILTILIFFSFIINAYKHSKKYNTPSFSIALFLVFYFLTTALKHAAFFIPFILVNLDSIKNHK